MTTYSHTRIEPNSPDVPDAVAKALAKSPDYVGIGRRGERVLLALHLGAAESQIVVAGIVKQVQAGELWLVYDKRCWDYDTQSYRYTFGPYLIAPDEAPMYIIEDAA